MTPREQIETAIIGRLRAAGCVFAEDEARLIMAVGGDTEALVSRRMAGEPLEYVLGFADFCGVRVALDAGVFIPRQRTAFLVRQAARSAPAHPRVVDLCCGSGALGLAFASLVDTCTLHATDLDPVAVHCAERNLRGVGQVHRGDLFSALPLDLHGRVDVLLANVPYVPTGELDAMPVEAREHEPSATHDGGPDGLDVARRVLAEAGEWLAPGGRVLVEIADEQRAAAATAVTAAGLGARIEADDDLGATIVIGTR